MASGQRTDFSSQVEAAIINNQADVLENLLQQADVNMCLNNRRDSPLFLAVKLSRRAVVRTLLSSPGCDLGHQNINYYSPLDLALVMVYDNQKEPRQSACWDILELLLEAGAEPACPDAMLYVVRTALKLNDDQFILRLICTLIDCSTSLDMHTLLLVKLHRNQPLYSGSNSDEFLLRASDFTMKLIKAHHKDALSRIISCFPYYFDSHWESREGKESLFIKLVVYVTIFGWKWKDQADLSYMARVSPDLAQWCYQLPRAVPSLTHACRLALSSSPYSRQFIIPSRIPHILLNYLNFSDIDSLLPFKPSFDFSSIQL
ncbi:uncharacterized protein LOC101848978 [Aplysia californica]|uniref:Uncharacterized protein LOC101848978 n=1 Tax=Aplysia californica TaxID=6500 RepID=A0ABM0JSX6_APLCA|nr:uncharacterized protein LOC101848978 [Aplysia californica]